MTGVSLLEMREAQCAVWSRKKEGPSMLIMSLWAGWLLISQCKEVEGDDLSTLVLETESRVSCRLGKYSHGP